MVDFLTHAFFSLHPEYLPYFTCVIAIASAIATVLPPPDQGSNKGYAMLYQGIHYLALNFGQGTAATNPKVTGLMPDGTPPSVGPNMTGGNVG